jgi:HEAT repeat protein
MENILWLFERLDLKIQLLKNLENKKWHKKAKAVQQLAHLQQKNCVDIILPFTNHQNDLLRMEAQIALVKMTGFEGLEFLNQVTYPVSEWQQLRLIEELSSNTITSLGSVHKWLKSENVSVVNFALRLIEIYQQFDFYDEVKTCLSHASSTVCKNAVLTISNISNETTADLLVEHFGNYDALIQIKILKILQSQGTENQLPFLFSILKHPDDSYKLEAAKAILKISDKGLLTIEELTDRESFPWNVILPQIKNVA